MRRHRDPSHRLDVLSRKEQALVYPLIGLSRDFCAAWMVGAYAPARGCQGWCVTVFRQAATGGRTWQARPACVLGATLRSKIRWRGKSYAAPP
jgi:hypothetical protein